MRAIPLDSAVISDPTSLPASTWSSEMGDAAAVEARIAHILSTDLHLGVLPLEMDLFEAGKLDSLGFVELLLHLEKEFGIKVPVEDLELEHFRTIRRIAQVVMRPGR